jgi:hypothetical protein
MTQRDQSWWDQAVADLQSRVTASRPNTTVTTTQTNPSSTARPSNSTSATSGTQFVQTRDGSVNYDAIPFERYSGSMNNAFNQANNAQRQMLDLIGGWRLRDPNTQATADATRTTANAAMKQAEADYLRAQNEGSATSKEPFSPYGDLIRKYQDGTFKSGAEQYQDILARRREKQDYVFTSNIDAANQAKRDKAQYDLDAMVARINADAQKSVARIQQPLSASHILEKTRIENPDPMKGMAMNLLGSYANQGTRSNFAYWG